MSRRKKTKRSDPPPEFAPAEHGLTAAAGDLIELDGRTYITHSGLLKVARRNRCSSITTELISEQTDAAARRYVVRASVYKTSRSKPFHGLGDADPSNVSSLVRGAELRVAETRATNRALRKAYGIGLCSIEELGGRAEPHRRGDDHGSAPDRLPFPATNEQATTNAGSGVRSLRDQLALLIRRHQLDPDQVKRYALGFCKVDELRQASREQIGAFVEHLGSRADNDYPALLKDLSATMPKPPTGVGRSEQEESA